ncbi:MAG: restriction endonuclease subunit S [Magnetococcales bacterium]|nr:restriction endonuclease subunit S [Magnetococcales bacterium]
MPLDLRSDHLAIIQEILQRHAPDQEVWAFGSRVQGTARAASDLDLCIRGDEPIGFERLARLRDAFSASPLPFRVDMVDWATTADGFRGIIERNRVAVQKKSLDMVNEWKQVKLGEVLGQKGYIRGPFGSALKRDELQSSGIPVYEQQHAIYGTREFRFFIDEGKHRKLSRFTVQADDLIISCSGTLGRVSLIRDTDPVGIISQALLILRPDTRVISPRFLLQILSSPAGFHSLVSVSTGSVQVNIANRSIIENVDLLLPPLTEQRAIAAVLGALDDKIELNRRMSADLEAMARALFKDWFVDFGPVRAKTEGRPAYLAKEIWDLFPDALDDEDKPVGWRYGALKEVAESPCRGIKPSDVSEDTPYIGLEHMPRRSIALADWAHAGKVTSNKSVFNKGEFLFGKLRPYFHKVGIAAINGICSTDIVVVRPKGKEWGGCVLACISSDPFVNYTDQLSNGAKMPRTSWNDMGAYEICIPDKPVAQTFEDTVAPMLGQIIHNIHESQFLAQLRDLLLPRLMTGEIRVCDAEKAVEVAL